MLGGKHMRNGPKGQRRPVDVITNAVHIMPIATGEAEEVRTRDGKNAAAVELGRKGGATRAQRLSAKKRRDIAKQGAAARWRRK